MKPMLEVSMMLELQGSENLSPAPSCILHSVSWVLVFTIFNSPDLRFFIFYKCFQFKLSFLYKFFNSFQKVWQKVHKNKAQFLFLLN